MISSAQCRAARAWLQWTQAELAQRSQVGLSAVKNFEAESVRTLPAIRNQIERAFEDAGAEFPDANTVRIVVKT
ncbi:MAG TPA: transcriptional regulator [Stellaceae bacterium]|nr:transcriptional regulator [Stellaceae bacterium]